MLAIRLSRAGAKKRPYYNIVIADSRSPRDGRFVEKVGTYNPMLPKEHADRVRLERERLAYWLSVGANLSDRVARFLATAELIKPKVRREQAKKPQPKAKAVERAKAEAAKAAAGAEAAAS